MRRMRAWLRAVMPKTLFSRALLIVLVPMLLAQTVATVLFYTRHWDAVSRHMAMGLANEIAYVAHRARQPETRNISLALAQEYFALQASWGPPQPMEPGDDAGRFAHLRLHLEERLDVPFSIRNFGTEKDILVMMHMPEGTLRILADGKRIASPTTYIFVLWINGAAILFLIIAVIFLRNQVKPIQQLAAAAEAFGRGQDIEHYKPRGALEVRRAGHAFILMSERIKRQIIKRTQMLAAISHDLRTPLTRMKLQLAMMEGGTQTADLNRDIEEMEMMIREYLDFVRGEGTEVTVPVSVASVVQDLAADYQRQGRPFHLSVESDAMLPMREHAMRRALSNLLNNAFAHAKDVWLTASASAGHVRLVIEDNGPGIPEGEYSKAFEAFHRLNEARTPGGGNVGLGLSIAKDIVLSHGGMIRLGRAPQGGLMVEIILPR